MIVCVCNNINEKQLKSIIEKKPDVTIKELQALNICDKCYKCVPDVEDIIDEINYDKKRI